MKLNRLQRHTAYIIMLEESGTMEYDFYFCKSRHFTTNKRVGLCKLFEILTGEDQFLMMDVLPEIMKKKPNTQYNHDYWFDTNDWGKRIELLKQCIQETY